MCWIGDIGSTRMIPTWDYMSVDFPPQAVLHEVELLSRQDYPLRVSMQWKQASSKAALSVTLEFQVRTQEGVGGMWTVVDGAFGDDC